MSKLHYLVIVPLVKDSLVFKSGGLITIPITSKTKIAVEFKNFIKQNRLKVKGREIKLATKKFNETNFYPITFLTTHPKNSKLLCKKLELIKLEFPAPYDQIICESLAQFNQQFKRPKKRLFFYGGSFNPLHKGHIECVRQFPFKKDLVIVPDYNPFKLAPAFRNVFQNYQELLKAFSKFKVTIYSGFYGLTKPNPTYSWLKKIKADQLGLVMGDDNFLTLEKWFMAEKLLKKIDSLYVVPRIFTLAETLTHREYLLQKFPHLKIFVLKEHSYQNLSSTKLRKKKI